jgi:DNA-binding response OmpR family regulator
VENGAQALTLLAEPGNKPDLIILDLNTPRVDGRAFLARYEGNATPVVVFTSSESSRDRDAALELGAQDYVVKPIDLNQFTDTVWTMIWRWTRRKNSNAGTTSSP